VGEKSKSYLKFKYIPLIYRIKRYIQIVDIGFSDSSQKVNKYMNEGVEKVVDPALVCNCLKRGVHHKLFFVIFFPLLL